jgi:hypothetical protein
MGSIGLFNSSKHDAQTTPTAMRNITTWRSHSVFISFSRSQLGGLFVGSVKFLFENFSLGSIIRVSISVSRNSYSSFFCHTKSKLALLSETDERKTLWSFSELKKFHNLNAQNLLEFIPLSSKLLNNFPEQICGIKESKINDVFSAYGFMLHKIWEVSIQ